MWRRLSIATKLVASLVIVVVLGFAILGIEQAILVDRGVNKLADKDRRALTALLVRNIAGAVRWKKSEVIARAYEEFAVSDDSSVSEIVVTDTDGNVINEFIHPQRTGVDLKRLVDELIATLGENTVSIREVGSHGQNRNSVLTRPVSNPKDNALIGYLIVAFSNEEIDALVDRQVLVTTGVSLIVALLIAVAVYFIVRFQFSRPMLKLNAVVNDLANGEGDLTQRLQVNSADELGELANHVNLFLDKLQAVVANIIGSAGEVRDSMNRAKTTADQNRVLLDQHSGELSEAAGSVQAMSQSLGSMSNSARGLAGFTDDARKEAEGADRLADEAVTAVSSLTSRMKDSESVISRLKEQSETIGSVLGVIEGIAEQTNLLALNAAIEAARAGEQGRGFAVVADEVRTLASRTQQSTEEIKDIIDGLQDGAQNAAQAMEKSQVDVESSANQINLVKQSLAQIVDFMEQISNTNNEVAAGVNEQSDVASRISSNIEQISNLSASILDNGISTAECCEQSSNINEKLNEQVAFFKV